MSTRWRTIPPAATPPPYSVHANRSSCQRQLRYTVLESIFIGIRRSVHTYRELRSLHSPEGLSLIALCTIPQEGTSGIFFGQVLGHPEQHHERTLFDMKTPNNRIFFHDSSLFNKQGSLQRRDYAENRSVVLRLFRERV